MCYRLHGWTHGVTGTVRPGHPPAGPSGQRLRPVSRLLSRAQPLVWGLCPGAAPREAEALVESLSLLPISGRAEPRVHHIHVTKKAAQNLKRRKAGVLLNLVTVLYKGSILRMFVLAIKKKKTLLLK